MLSLTHSVVALLFLHTLFPVLALFHDYFGYLFLLNKLLSLPTFFARALLIKRAQITALLVQIISIPPLRIPAFALQDHIVRKLRERVLLVQSLMPLA